MLQLQRVCSAYIASSTHHAPAVLFLAPLQLLHPLYQFILSIHSFIHSSGSRYLPGAARMDHGRSPLLAGSALGSGGSALQSVSLNPHLLQFEEGIYFPIKAREETFAAQVH